MTHIGNRLPDLQSPSPKRADMTRVTERERETSGKSQRRRTGRRFGGGARLSLTDSGSAGGRRWDSKPRRLGCCRGRLSIHLVSRVKRLSEEVWGCFSEFLQNWTRARAEREKRRGMDKRTNCFCQVACGPKPTFPVAH